MRRLPRLREATLAATAVALVAATTFVAIQIAGQQRAVAQISNNNLAYVGTSAAIELLRLSRSMAAGELSDVGDDLPLRAEIFDSRTAILNDGTFWEFARQTEDGAALVRGLRSLSSQVLAAAREGRGEHARLVAELRGFERPLLSLSSRANQAGNEAVAAGRADLEQLFTKMLAAVMLLLAIGTSLLILAMRGHLRLRRANTALEEAKERYRELAHRDDLTGLPNRSLFMRELAAARRPTVALLDLDGFKAVNDGHGHAAGDALLVEVAGRIASLAAAYALSARLGGDEFALLSKTDDMTFNSTVSSIVEALAEEFPIADAIVSIGASAGIAASKADEPIAALLGRADRALYHAKRSGRGRVSEDLDRSTKFQDQVTEAA